MTYINWALVPEATHYAPSPVPGDDFYVASFALLQHGRFKRAWQIEGDRVIKVIENPIYTNERQAEMIERPVWVDGLPPAGIECEFSLNRGKVDWPVGFVVGNSCAHQVVIKYGLNEFHARNRHGVRPIRSADDIAAEERLAAINFMELDAGMTATAFDGDPEARVWIENLIDKGWRKPGAEQ